MTQSSSPISPNDLDFIHEAAAFFENPGRSVKLVSKLGSHLEQAEALLPPKAKAAIQKAAQQALYAAAKVAVSSLPRRGIDPNPAEMPNVQRERLTHIGVASAMGAAGGFFGLAALPIELSAVTVTMLRGIAEIAETMGFDPRDPEIQMHCLYVFSLGTPSSADDHLNTSYYSSRVAFSEVLREATRYAAGLAGREVLRAIENRAAPAVTALVVRVADQFQMKVTRKFVAQAVPVAGAVGGAAINAWFADLFCACARYHFGLMRLEKLHGTHAIQTEFQNARATAQHENSTK